MNRSSFIPATTELTQRTERGEGGIKCRRRDQCRFANGSDELLRLLSLRFGTLFLCVLFDVVLGHFPSLVPVVLVHALERF